MKKTGLFALFLINCLFSLPAMAAGISLQVGPAELVVGELIVATAEVYDNDLPSRICWDDGQGKICEDLAPGNDSQFLTSFATSGPKTITAVVEMESLVFTGSAEFVVYDTILRIDSVIHTGRKYTVNWTTRGLKQNVRLWIDQNGFSTDLAKNIADTGSTSFEIPGRYKGVCDLWLSLETPQGFWKLSTVRLVLK